VVEQQEAAAEAEPEAPASEVQIPLGIVIARILVVSGIGVAAALAIFFLVGAIWIPAGIAFVATVVFLALMFGIEKLAES
jgi:hypothetical protein